jgi:hypothetical protein
VEANSPFNKAAKHFFRHLHEPRVLRRSPLARKLLNTASLLSVGPGAERAALARIHAVVREGAAHYRDLDFKNGKQLRGLRQYAIITRQCLEREPIGDLAKSLGISKQHCYRERANICQRVARFIYEGGHSRAVEHLAELDEFRSLADRAAREVASGNLAASLHHHELLTKAATSYNQKIEAFCRKADAALSFGKVKVAEATFSAAMKHAAGSTIAKRSSEAILAQAWLDLTGAKFAYFKGDAQQAIKLMQSAARNLEPLQASGQVYIRELYAESLSDVAASLWNIGDRYRAYDYMVKAEECARALPVTSSQTRCHVTIQFWKFRSQLLMSTQHWSPVSDRVRALTEVFEAAYASGWRLQAIEALGVMVTSTALAGKKAEAIRFARLALALAVQQENERVRALVPVALATHLVSTDCWKDALAIFSTVKRLEDCERYLHSSVSYIVAARALRFRQFNDAWRLANDSIQEAEPTDLTLRKKVVAATAACELGRQPLARQILEEVIPRAEALGSVPILRDAYYLAGKVAGSDRKRLQRRARELDKLLAM